MMKIILVLILSIFSMSSFAGCLSADLPKEKVEADKVWVDEKILEKKPGYVGIYLQVEKEVFYTLFSCHRMGDLVNCSGDDDGGSFIVNGNKIHLDRAIIGNPERYAEFKGAKGYFDLKKMKCPKSKK